MAKTRAAAAKDEAIIAALLSNPTVKKAATACGVSERKVYSRLKDKAFKDKYDNARRELLVQCTAYLQGITGEALEKMHDVMNDPDATPQVQLNAANAIASNNLKMTEQTDIIAQIEELKRAVFPNEQRN